MIMYLISTQHLYHKMGDETEGRETDQTQKITVKEEGERHTDKTLREQHDRTETR